MELNLTNKYSISVFLRRFKDSNIENEYRKNTIELDSLHTAKGLFLLAIINILFVFADYHAFPNSDPFTNNLLSRILMLALGLAAYVLLKSNVRIQKLDLTILTYAALTIIILTWQVLNLTFYAAVSPTLFDALITYLIITMATFILLPNPIVYQLTITLLLFLSFLVVSLTGFNIADDQFPFAILFLLLTLMVGYTTSARRHSLQRIVWANLKIQQQISNKLQEEILQKELLEKELRKLAATDALTGINNRRQFFTSASNELERANRYGGDLALLMIDIDYFKQINDKFGHLAGDKVLVAITQIMKDTLRNTDLIGRIGGEEFAIILLNSSEQDSMEISERIRDKVASSVTRCGDKNIKATVSIGVSRFTQNNDTFEKLIEKADRSMYQAKSDGRNRVVSS